MPTNTSGGTTTSLNNTVQAKDDLFTALEDQILYFDVMANDLGGNAKVLWSIDETSDDGSGDLVAKDFAGVCEYSERGAKISLTADGKIKYDTTALDSLAAGETVTDQFTYAIRLSNGTLSWATVTVSLTGSNDAPVAEDDVGAGNEDTLIIGDVAANDNDVDNGAVLTFAVNGATPSGFVMNPDGSWTLNAGHAAYQHLAAGADPRTSSSAYTVTDQHGANDTAHPDDHRNRHQRRAGRQPPTPTPLRRMRTLTVDVLANDTDVDDGAVLTVIAASAPDRPGHRQAWSTTRSCSTPAPTLTIWRSARARLWWSITP